MCFLAFALVNFSQILREYILLKNTYTYMVHTDTHSLLSAAQTVAGR